MYTSTVNRTQNMIESKTKKMAKNDEIFRKQPVGFKDWRVFKKKAWK